MACSRHFRLAMFVPLLALVAGCSDEPKAPPLIREAVYQNDKIGLRFLAPDGWLLTSRSTLPPGALPKVVMLVTYILNRGDRQAEFNLVAADVPEGEDVGRYLEKNRVGIREWTLTPTAEPVTVNGTEGTRYLLAKGDMRREATAFRRGGRVYAFLVSYRVTDTASRDTGRNSVTSATWY